MYGIFTYIWLIYMVNVGKYTIHGCYGYLITPILNNYFGDGVTSQNIFFKIILDFNIVGDGVPISQNNLITFYVILLF